MIREAIARACHIMWSSYMSYFLARLPVDGRGNRIISSQYVKSLIDLIDTPFDELTEVQKDLDRDEADRIIKAMVEAK